MEQSKIWDDIKRIRKERSELKKQLLMHKANIENLTEDPLFVGYTKTKIDEMLKDLDSSFIGYDVEHHINVYEL